MQMTDRQKKIWGIATVIGLVVFMGLLCWFVGRPMIRFVSELSLIHISEPTRH